MCVQLNGTSTVYLQVVRDMLNLHLQHLAMPGHGGDSMGAQCPQE